MATSTPCFKMILIGEYGVGKSSLFRRFIDNSFTVDTGPQSTLGLDNFKKKFSFGTEEISIELWDTAGLERFATLSASYFQSATAAILCYSLCNRESFGLLSQHILDTVMHSKTAKIFLCGNKKDLLQDGSGVRSSDIVTDEDIVQFQDECEAVVKGSYKVSCKSGANVKEMFSDIASVVFNDVYTKFDPTRIRITRYSQQELPEEKKKCCS